MTIIYLAIIDTRKILRPLFAEALQVIIKCQSYCILNVADGGYYTLRDVIFFLEKFHSGFREYRTMAKEAGVTAVVVQDTENLRNYLTGAISTCDQIDPEALNVQPLEVPQQATTSAPAEEEVKIPQLSEEELQEHRKRIDQLHKDILDMY